MTEVTNAAVQKGLDSLDAPLGRVPEKCSPLAEHAPGAFAGFGLMRDFAMRDKAAGGA